MDVFGKLFELEQLQQVSNPKLIGAALFEDGRGIRDLARPSRVPGTQNTPAADSIASSAYACPTGVDNGCVHAHASVIGHAFYLMTFGGRNVPAACAGSPSAQSLAKPSLEEPDAGILHVRICAGVRLSTLDRPYRNLLQVVGHLVHKRGPAR